MICDDGFTSIWMTAGGTFYAAHTPCGELGQWTQISGVLKCLKCGLQHPRRGFFTVGDAISLHRGREEVERWVAWFYNVLPEAVEVSITY